MVFSSRKTTLEVLATLVINLTSGWFGVLLITPGLFSVPIAEYGRLLLINMPFGILGLLISLWLTERGKTL